MTNYQEILPTRLRMAGGESLRFGTIALIAFLHARRGRWLRLERTFDEYRELRRSFIFPYNGNRRELPFDALRAKIKYRPVVFELMPPTFTLLQLQRSVEALAGCLVHIYAFACKLR